MPRPVLLSVIAATLVVAASALWLMAGSSLFDSSDGSPPMMCSGGRCCCARKKVRAGDAAASGDRLTLDPDQFIGPVKQAYVFAGKNPALIAQLWCYCGCDKTDGHRSLLDCYRGNHGAICATCTGEALMAKQMSEQGSPVDQIRDAIRRRYAEAE
jgi:hypothetical protein